MPDFNPLSGDRTLWLDEATGRTLAASRVLASGPAPGNIVTPGFDGRFYYVSAAGQLWELRPRFTERRYIRRPQESECERRLIAQRFREAGQTTGEVS